MITRLAFVMLLITSCRQLGSSPSEMPVQIVNGSDVTDPNDPVHKSTIALLNASGQIFCSGTLVGPNQITTAAHCLHPNMGGSSFSNIGFGYQPKADASISNIKYSYHPKFDPNVISQSGDNMQAPVYDVAIVTFEGQIPAGFQPVSIPDSSSVSDGMAIKHAGYGMTETDRNDVGILRAVGNTLTRVLPVQKEFVINTPGSGTCQGDSGGPTYITEGSDLKVIGATSRGEAPCSSGNGMYTFLPQFTGWLSCAFEKAGKPKTDLKDDDSNIDCSQTTAYDAGNGPNGGGSQPDNDGGGILPPPGQVDPGFICQPGTIALIDEYGNVVACVMDYPEF